MRVSIWFLKIHLFCLKVQYILSSHRIEPNSRTFLICEQQNPFQLVHRKDKVSRHRGGKQRGQYELSRAITLLSLA
jgi:hypothetical protein